MSDIDREIPPMLSSSSHALIHSLDSGVHHEPLSAIKYQELRQLITKAFSRRTISTVPEIGELLLNILKSVDKLLKPLLDKAFQELEDVIPFGMIACKDWLNQKRY